MRHFSEQWSFWPVIGINRVIDQNIQKLLIFAVFASYIASILKSDSESLWQKGAVWKGGYGRGGALVFYATGATGVWRPTLNASDSDMGIIFTIAWTGGVYKSQKSWMEGGRGSVASHNCICLDLVPTPFGLWSEDWFLRHTQTLLNTGDGRLIANGDYLGLK